MTDDQRERGAAPSRADVESSGGAAPGDVTIVLPPPPELNINCYGFHVNAEDFLIASKAYAPQARQGSLVAHFLCCQSIELAFKAFLSLKGATKKKLRHEYGHDIAKLHLDARAQGIGAMVTLLPTDAEVAAAATAWYDSKAGKKFQYFDVYSALRGYKGVPELQTLEDMAERLQSKLLRNAVLNP